MRQGNTPEYKDIKSLSLEEIRAEQQEILATLAKEKRFV